MELVNSHKNCYFFFVFLYVSACICVTDRGQTWVWVFRCILPVFWDSLSLIFGSLTSWLDSTHLPKIHLSSVYQMHQITLFAQMTPVLWSQLLITRLSFCGVLGITLGSSSLHGSLCSPWIFQNILPGLYSLQPKEKFRNGKTFYF